MTIRLLLISGSTRGASTNTAVLRTAAAISLPGVEAKLETSLSELPAFNPDHDVEPLPPVVAGLRARIAAADGVLFCTPEYAGALPGSFKNLLDWTVGGMAIQGKAVGWINVSTSPTGAVGAHESLATVLRYVEGRMIQGACVHIPVRRDQVGADGLAADEDIREQIGAVVAVLVTGAGP